MASERVALAGKVRGAGAERATGKRGEIVSRGGEGLGQKDPKPGGRRGGWCGASL